MTTPSSPEDPQPIKVWGIPFAPWTLSRTIDEVERLIEVGQPAYFMTVNLHTTMLAWEDAAVKAVVSGAAFVVADGMPLVWASRLQHRRLPARVTGADLFPALCERASLKGYRVYFLGGPAGSGEAAARNLTGRYPGLQVVGIESPPYRALTEGEAEAIRERIRAARPHLLFVSFGQPKAEFWVRDNCPLLGGTVCVNIGAALDFAAGRISRAPRWMQKTGLEWTYRLGLEPRRLVGRYARNAAFIARRLAGDVRVKLRKKSRA